MFMNQPEDGDEPRLELTYNIGRDEPYDLGTGYGHIAITARTSTPRWSACASRGSSPSARPTR